MTTMYSVAEGLRKESFQLLIRGFISPYLDSFEPQDINGNRAYVNKEEFFSIIRRFRAKRFGPAEEDEFYNKETSPRYEAEVWSHIEEMSAHLYDMLSGNKVDSPSAKDVASTKVDQIRRRRSTGGPPGAAASSSSTLGGGGRLSRSSDRGGASTPSKGGGGAREDDDNSVPSSRRSSMVREASGEDLEVPEGCITFTNLRIMSVLGTDGVITSATQREAMNRVLDDYVDRTGQSNITREEFVVELPKYERKFPELAHLDFETLAFYLFPEKDANVIILRRLIDMTHSPPIRNTFITEYTKMRVVKGADIRDLLWFVPFLVLYLCVVLSGRGVTPRSYMGRGIVLGLNTAIDGYDFPTCSRDTSGNFTCDASEMMSVADATSADHVYGFMQGGIANIFWPTSGNGAGETVITNSLRVTGALKIRQQRVLGSPVTDYSADFFEPLYTQQTERFPPYSTSELNKADFPPASTFIQDRVLMPWDGSKFGTCDELNGTSTITGINKDVECDGYAVIVPFNVTKTDFIGVVSELAAANWIQADTRNVVIDVILFHLDSVMFVKLQLLFEFQAGGAVSIGRQITPFFFHDAASQSTVLDVFYYIFIIYLVVLVVRFILKQIFGGVLVQLQQMKWVLLDLLCFITFTISIIVRIFWIVLGAPSDPAWQLDHFPAKYEYGALLYQVLTSVDGFNAIISILAVFRFTKFFARLNTVVNTLQRSLVDGAVIAFLTATVLFAFAICATIVWGDRLLGYQTVPTSALTLLLTFIGEFDYRPLHDEQPTFSFLFFGAFTLVAIATLLNMVVAVFSDSFDDEQQASFKATAMSDILDNNRHHMLDGWTLRTTLYNTEPVQFALRIKNIVVDCCCRKNVEPEPMTASDGTVLEVSEEDRRRLKWEEEFNRDLESKYNYVSFDTNMMVDVLDVLQPSWKNRREQPPVARRAQAAACLLKLIDRYVDLPGYCPNNVKDIAVSTSVYDYAKFLFGSFDYYLIMTLLVMVPQSKFGYSGIAGLLEAARTHKRWHEEVSRKAVRVDDLDMLALRVAAVKEQAKVRNEWKKKRVAHRRDNNKASSSAAAAAGDDSGRGGSVSFGGKASMVESMSGFEASLGRSLLGAVQSTGGAVGPRKELRDFERLCDSLSYLNRRIFLGVLACASFKHFGEGSKLTRDRFIQITTEMGDYPSETYPADELYERLGIESWQRREGIVIIPMDDVAAQFQEEFASQCLGFNFTHDEALEFEEAILNTLVAGGAFPDIKTGERKAILQDNVFKVNREEFTEIWHTAKGLNPPEVTLARVENIFPDERIDLELFLHFCRGDPGSHQKRSFQSEFAARMARVSTFLIWCAFYVPFLFFIVAVAMIKNSTEDNVHVGVGLRESFAPSADVSVFSLGQSQTYLDNFVSGIWSGLPSDRAQPHNFVNYFIGSLRIRQVRVHKGDESTCNEVFDEFFGDSSSGSLTFPEGAYDSSTQAFYTQRVQRDFSNLVSKSCFYAYSTGGSTDKSDRAIPASVTTPEVQDAFRYRDEGGTDLASHDSTYVSGGYYLDIPFNRTTSEAKAMISELLTGTSWLDTQTRAVVAEFSVFNNNLRLYSHSRFGFEITSGGAFYPIRRLATLEKPRGLATKEFIGVAIVLWFFLAVYLLLFFSDLGSKIRDKMVRLKVSLFQSFLSTILENVMLMLDVVVILLTIATWIWSAVSLSSMDVDSLSLDGTYPVEIEKVISQAANNKILEGVVIVFAFFRFLHILSFNRRVNLLFETFRRAFNDLIAILVLFVISLLAFSIGAILLFGYLINDHFNVQNSFFDLFNTASGGNPSYPDLVDLRRQISVFYYLMFVAVCIIVLYNMVIAVLTGAFSDVKNDLFDPSEAVEVLSQAMRDRKELEERQAKGKRDRVREFCSPITKFGAAIGASIRQNPILRECYHMVAWRRCCRDSRLINNCRVGRSLWANQAKWWTAVDSSLPRQSCLAGLNLLILEREVAIEKRDAQLEEGGDVDEGQQGKKGHPTKLLDDDAISIESGRPHSQHSFTKAGDGRLLEEEANGSLEMYPAGEIESELSLLPRFRSYGERRRLPLWQEFLYSKFRNDFLSVQQHIVEIPAYLLAQQEENIWLEVVEVEHYFRLDQASYNVDCDGSPIEDLYWQMPPVRRERGDDEDQDDSDKEEMARLAAVSAFANDKPAHSPNAQKRSSISSTGASPPRRSLDIGLVQAPPPAARLEDDDAVVGASPHQVPTGVFANKEPLARGNTEDYSPANSPRNSTHPNGGSSSAAAATPPVDESKDKRDGEDDEDGIDPHRPPEDNDIMNHHRRASVDVSSEVLVSPGAADLDA